LTIEDNGHGFENALVNGSADGLRNMRQRMEELNGEFRMESNPDTGTRITLIYHWPKQNEL
jgi:signal transduction histidine kinase